MAIDQKVKSHIEYIKKVLGEDLGWNENHPDNPRHRALVLYQKLRERVNVSTITLRNLKDGLAQSQVIFAKQLLEQEERIKKALESHEGLKQMANEVRKGLQKYYDIKDNAYTTIKGTKEKPDPIPTDEQLDKDKRTDEVV